MIFVDTSVWISAFRSANSAAAQHLRALLDSGAVALAIPVRIELLMGSSSKDRSRLRRVLSALPVFHPSESMWQLVESWVDVATAAGERFGFADLMIGALAAEHQSSIWSLDADFERLSRLGLLELHQPR